MHPAVTVQLGVGLRKVFSKSVTLVSKFEIVDPVIAPLTSMSPITNTFLASVIVITAYAELNPTASTIRIEMLESLENFKSSLKYNYPGIQIS